MMKWLSWTLLLTTVIVAMARWFHPALFTTLELHALMGLTILTALISLMYHTNQHG